MTTAVSAISQHWLQKKYDTLMSSIFVHRKEKRVKEKENLHNLFFKLRDRFGQTFIIVTHNEELANLADRKITMQDGHIKV